MRAIIQRVTYASVTIDGEVKGEIAKGFMVLLGVNPDDTQKEVDFLAAKTAKLRVFEDPDGKMNLALDDVGGEVLVVSNFTLYADLKKGNRPSFTGAGRPEIADPLYQSFVAKLKENGIKKVETGEFGADMKLQIHNDGPCTFILDTAEIMPK